MQQKVKIWPIFQGIKSGLLQVEIRIKVAIPELTGSRSTDIPKPGQGQPTYRSRHASRMSGYLLCFFMCAGKLNRVRKPLACVCRMPEDGAVSRTTVKARVLSLQSRGRRCATSSMGRCHLTRVAGLHTADRSGTRRHGTSMEACHSGQVASSHRASGTTPAP